jgi:glycerol-3-phosphate dehydrogenase
MADLDLFDVAIIGGGVNGCGIARDAAGRGHRVFLCDKGDLASGTSSASTKLIHGGLRYLEHYEFRLVREALLEREVLWGIAPHIIWPLRFVLPHHKRLRPAWLLRLGLFLYDHMGARKRLPPTRTLRLQQGPSGTILLPGFTLGFEYSDCWVDDARLVVLNARDAADRGAIIAPRTECVGAERDGDAWRVSVRDATTGAERVIRAGVLVNAAGPWVAHVSHSVVRPGVAAAVRQVKGSHIVVPRLYEHGSCYIFQNEDGRIFFAIPYQQDFTLIGTTDEDFHGDPDQVHASEAEIAYLCRSADAYLRTKITPEMVVWSYAGIRPLYDDGSADPAAATRDYVLKLDAPEGAPALLSVFGGKITTYRRLAEHAMSELAPHLPARSGLAPGWTGRTPLPGGGFPVDGFDALVADIAARYAFLPPATVRRLCRAYGTNAAVLLGNAASPSDLGRAFGADLTEAEVRYLIDHEWARTAIDVVWRRSKLGLRLSAAEVDALDQATRTMVQAASGAPTRSGETIHDTTHPGH